MVKAAATKRPLQYSEEGGILLLEVLGLGLLAGLAGRLVLRRRISAVIARDIVDVDVLGDMG